MHGYWSLFSVTKAGQKRLVDISKRGFLCVVLHKALCASWALLILPPLQTVRIVFWRNSFSETNLFNAVMVYTADIYLLLIARLPQNVKISRYLQWFM